MKYLFLDTNIFLHFNSFEDIPWRNLVNDDFTIVISPIIQQELDKHKDQSREKIQIRARKMSSLLFDYLIGNKECRVPIVRCKEPIPTDLDRRRMDLSINDNRLILSAFQSGFRIEDIILVTGDKHNVFRAMDNNLGYLLLDEKYRLKPEKTEAEKRIEQLEYQLKDATNKVPNPIVQFEDGSSSMTYERYIIEDEKAIVDKTMEAIEKEVPELHYEETDDHSIEQSLNRTIKAIQSNWYPRYNQDRKEYLKEERTYLELSVRRDCLDKRFARISFRLENEGNAPTGFEKLYFVIPKHVKVYSKKNSRERHNYIKPIKPGGPLSCISRDEQRNLIMLSAPFTGDDNSVWMWNPDKPIKHNGVFEIEPDSVMQKLSEKLDLEFYIDLRNEKSFDIQWAIIDEYLPDPITGILSIHINEVPEENDHI